MRPEIKGYLSTVLAMPRFIRYFPSLILGGLRESRNIIQENRRIGEQIRQMSKDTLAQLSPDSSRNERLAAVARLRGGAVDLHQERWSRTSKEYQETMLRLITQNAEEAQQKYQKSGDPNAQFDYEMNIRMANALSDLLKDPNKPG